MADTLASTRDAKDLFEEMAEVLLDAGMVLQKLQAGYALPSEVRRTHARIREVLWSVERLKERASQAPVPGT